MIVNTPRFMEGPLNLLKTVLLQRAIKRGLFKLSAGGESKYYIDCRKASMCYQGISAIGEAITACFLDAKLLPTVVCGPESAGIPLVSAVVVACHRINYTIEGCFARKETKDHGTKSAIEGYELTEHDRVLMVEDVATTGTSLLKAIDQVRASGAVVIGSICLVDRLQGAQEKIEGAGVQYKALLTVRDLGLE